MSINDVSLTAGMRGNLVSLQSTVDLLNRTQTRLSTGKKVNTALDNPLNFFTAQALTSRANDLAGFKDGMSEAVQTVSAANAGITAISSLIAQAKAIAASAKATAVGSPYNVETLTVGSMVAGDTVTVGGYTFTAVLTAASAGTTGFLIGATTGATAANLATAISTQATASAGSLSNINVLGSVAGNVITLQSAVTDLVASSVGVGYNHEAITVNSVITNMDTLTIGGWSFTAVLTAAYAGTTSFLIGADASTTATNLKTAIAAQATASAASLAGVTVVTAASSGATITLRSSTTDITASTIANGTNTPIAEGTISTASDIAAESAFSATPASDRANYYNQYVGILSQIDNLSADSGYKGTNLLQTGNSLEVSFGTAATDKLTITGFDATSTGLAVAKTNLWGTNANITTDVASLDAATSTLKAQSASLASNLSVINVRQDWVKGMVNVLTQGADNLTLADMNEEGANMLMLNTRNSLGTTALSLSSQAAQSVLRLF